MQDVLESHFLQLELPPDAVAWLLAVWTVFQGLDDWVDGTETSRAAQDATIWAACVGLSANTFFSRHATWLQPIMANAVLKWQAADHVERHRQVSQYPKSYVWRAGYYDLVLQAVLLVHGPDIAARLAPTVMSLYGESYDDYVKEFSDA